MHLLMHTEFDWPAPLKENFLLISSLIQKQWKQGRKFAKTVKMLNFPLEN